MSTVIYNFIYYILLYSDDVMEMNMQMCSMQHNHTIVLCSDDVMEMNMQMRSMQHNHTIVLCIYSNEVCNVYIKQNICNAEYTYTWIVYYHMECNKYQEV